MDNITEINESQKCLEGGQWDCHSLYNCCDCGGNQCGCAYCFSCHACSVCLDKND